ncbi:TPA: hypothetical protein DD425_01555 [Candidatus Saccharibacteria bacterium]|nr:hypothetical protein [Candidatus Saccharibacteria bacterium]|tara:strand:+ start:552 stop:890 length:339 start_codon:yes stop_codon:yes gene_type:complete
MNQRVRQEASAFISGGRDPRYPQWEQLAAYHLNQLIVTDNDAATGKVLINLSTLNAQEGVSAGTLLLRNVAVCDRLARALSDPKSSPWHVLYLPALASFSAIRYDLRDKRYI